VLNFQRHASLNPRNVLDVGLNPTLMSDARNSQKDFLKMGLFFLIFVFFVWYRILLSSWNRTHIVGVESRDVVLRITTVLKVAKDSSFLESYGLKQDDTISCGY